LNKKWCYAVLNVGEPHDSQAAFSFQNYCCFSTETEYRKTIQKNDIKLEQL